jgi:thiol-disulfide isomerase/thioredoxin
MKKVIIFIAVIVVLFASIGIITSMQNKEKVEGNPFNKDDLHPETIKILDDPNYQNNILPEDLEQKLNDGEDVTVYFYASDCPHCKVTTPVVAPLAEDLGIDLVQYNVLEFQQGWNDYAIEATPTIVHFKGGKEVARISGSQPEEITGVKPEVTFESWFQEFVLK